VNRALLVAAMLFAAPAAAIAQPAPSSAPSSPPPASPPAAPTGEVRTLTLAEAIALATSDSIVITVGKEQVAMAQADVRATRTHRLPTLSVKGGVQLWRDEITVYFPQDVDMDPATPDVPVPITLRPQVTGTAGATIVQPITAAIVLGVLIDLQEANVDATRADVQAKQLDAAYQVAEAYLSALQIDTLHQVAETSVRQIEANLVRAQALRKADVLGDVDILRIQAQLDATRQAVLETAVGAVTARNGLALLIGLPEGTTIQLAPVDTTPPELGWSEADAVAQARRQRPEARAAAARATQARLGVKVAQAQYLPNIVAVADYTHTFNVGGFGGEADSAFVGLNLEWNLWDWGERRANIQKSRAQSRSAKLLAEFTDETLAFDVRSKYANATTKRKQLDVALSGLKASEEAYRLQQVRFKEGAATTTDVLDAESEVARARSQATITRYQYLIAWMALVRAVGQIPEAPAVAPAPTPASPSQSVP